MKGMEEDRKFYLLIFCMSEMNIVKYGGVVEKKAQWYYRHIVVMFRWPQKKIGKQNKKCNAVVHES